MRTPHGSSLLGEGENLAVDPPRRLVGAMKAPVSPAAAAVGGWPMILYGLKTWLETGELLTTHGSLGYAPRAQVRPPSR